MSLKLWDCFVDPQTNKTVQNCSKIRAWTNYHFCFVGLGHPSDYLSSTKRSPFRLWVFKIHSNYIYSIWIVSSGFEFFHLKLWMWESAPKVLSFVSDGLRSNFFGFGCPIYCQQPSLSTAGFFFLLGLLTGFVLTAFLLWQFWTFLGAASSCSPHRGSAPPPAHPNRYSALAEYLNEPIPSRSRRRFS